METLQMPVKAKNKNDKDALHDHLRQQILDYSKDFKTSWVGLGQGLYSVWQDKLFYAWGFEKFEHYTKEEVGLKKEVAMRLLKTYLFLEEDEPEYLKKEFKEERDAVNVPNYDAINVLRLAKGRKEILKEDYHKLRKAIFDKGKDAAAVRKDLTAIMKERKPVDPDEERDQRNEMAIRKVINSLKNFNRDMETLKLIPNDILTQTKELMKKLESQVG